MSEKIPVIRCAYKRLVPIKELKAHPKNRNKHPASQIAQFAKILDFQGIRRPVRVSLLSGFVTVGHGLILASKCNGYTHLPVDDQEYDNEDMEYADIVADNAIALQAQLDFAAINLDIPDLGPMDIDLLGLKDFKIDIADKYGDKDADSVPETRKTLIQLGDLYQLGNHRLLCGDSTDKQSVEYLMNGEKADMVYTDPPYGLGDKKSFNKDHKDYEDSVPFDLRLLDLGQRYVVWGANYYDWLPEARNKIGWIVWDKRPTRDHWDQDTRDAADRIFGQHFEIACTNVTEVRGKMLRITWGGFYGTAGKPEEAIVHKTQKPTDLAIKCFQSTDKLILDYFLGSGSTLIACEKTNRKCFGMEIDPEYCQVIIDRWEKFTGQKAIKVN